MKKVSNDLQYCISQIEKFISTNQLIAELNKELEIIIENLVLFLDEIQNLSKAIIEGNDFYKPQVISQVELWSTKLKLDKLSPNNIQKNVLPKLISALNNIHKYNLPQYIERIGLYFTQNIKLILETLELVKLMGL